MKEREFEDFLISDKNITSKDKAVRSRINKGRMIERYLNTSLDALVSNNDSMYKVLLKIKSEMNDTNGSISNALRKYYLFVNGKACPSLAEFKKYN